MSKLSRNPHWLRGETDAQHARRRGWEPGQRLVGDEGYGPTVITITAIGINSVLAVPERARAREGVWTLAHRDWQPVES